MSTADDLPDRLRGDDGSGSDVDRNRPASVEQFASVTIALSTIEPVTVTLRDDEDEVMPLCVTPSDQRTDHGPVPVRVNGTLTDVVPQATLIVAGSVIVGRGAMAASAVLPALQPAPESPSQPGARCPTSGGVGDARRSAPPVMVPFVIDQAYVAPAPAFGTDALLLVEVEQTWRSGDRRGRDRIDDDRRRRLRAAAARPGVLTVTV